MNDSNTPKLGVIEGFFGRSWSGQERTGYAQFLAQNNYQFYIYAPKSDSYLRKNWHNNWPAAEFATMQQVRATYREHGIQFGIGLSPFEIYRNPSRTQRALLHQKIRHLNELEPDILCLLFDDMRGDLPELAPIQCELVQQVAELSTAKQIIFCPTYYSFDPILEKVFGQRPPDYWSIIGEHLNPKIDIFWTGEQVCSSHHTPEHLQAVADLFQRKPFLWDNYPVNDGAVKSKHLHLRALHTDAHKLTHHLAGHAVNPMNQPWLSRIPLVSLGQAYRSNTPLPSLHSVCAQLCGVQLADYLVADIELLQDVGLAKLTSGQLDYLLPRYQPLAAQSAYAKEVCDWLLGEYAFDPACLTD